MFFFYFIPVYLRKKYYETCVMFIINMVSFLLIFLIQFNRVLKSHPGSMMTVA